jgi:CheY-like chemotaxis protein
MLVVHDDDGVVESVRRDLWGWTVGAVDDGDVAVAEAHDFAAIVLDLRREPIDGWFVLARLGSLAGPPLIAISAPAGARRAFALGASAVVTDPDEVGAVIRAGGERGSVGVAA